MSFIPPHAPHPLLAYAILRSVAANGGPANPAAVLAAAYPSNPFGPVVGPRALVGSAGPSSLSGIAAAAAAAAAASGSVLPGDPTFDSVGFLRGQVEVLRGLANISLTHEDLSLALNRAAALAASMARALPIGARTATNAIEAVPSTAAAAAAASTAVASGPAFGIAPALAAATWTRFLELLRNSVSVAREALPWAGGVAVASAAAAVAFHVAAVGVPAWSRAARRRARRGAGRATAPGEPADLADLYDSVSPDEIAALSLPTAAAASASVASASPRPHPADMPVDALIAEVTALRLEVERFRAEAAAAAALGSSATPLSASSKPALLLPKSVLDDEAAALLHPDLEAAHLRSLEEANAVLRATVDRLNAELKDRASRELALKNEVGLLTAQAADSDREVIKLRGEVGRLMEDRDTQERRIGLLENNIDQLRTLFTSMVTSGSSRRSTPLPASPMDEELHPITPYLDLSNSSLTEDATTSESLRGSRIGLDAEPAGIPAASASTSAVAAADDDAAPLTTVQLDKDDADLDMRSLSASSASASASASSSSSDSAVAQGAPLSAAEGTLLAPSPEPAQDEWEHLDGAAADAASDK
ncbi:hypothetical protein HK405_009553 [Cladochytrium tenue]|nr:hypothetical protein HK405_009553 [Cladochytrium tenue]